MRKNIKSIMVFHFCLALFAMGTAHADELVHVSATVDEDPGPFQPGQSHFAQSNGIVVSVLPMFDWGVPVSPIECVLKEGSCQAGWGNVPSEVTLFNFQLEASGRDPATKQEKYYGVGVGLSAMDNTAVIIPIKLNPVK